MDPSKKRKMLTVEESALSVVVPSRPGLEKLRLAHGSGSAKKWPVASLDPVNKRSSQADGTLFILESRVGRIPRFGLKGKLVRIERV